jgi:hypothetical protein
MSESTTANESQPHTSANSYPSNGEGSPETKPQDIVLSPTEVQSSSQQAPITEHDEQGTQDPTVETPIAESGKKTSRELSFFQSLTQRLAWWCGPELIIVLFIGIALYNILWGISSSDDLLILASPLAIKDSKTWTIKGRVLDLNGQSIKDAVVWAVVSDNAGNRYVPEIPNTDDHGMFESKAIPETFAFQAKARPLNEAKIHAIKTESGGWFPNSRIQRGQTLLKLSENTNWRIQGAGGYIIFIFAWFGASILIAFMHSSFPKRVYYESIFMALGFTTLMGAFIALAQIKLGTTMTDAEVINLGVAYVFKGTYIKDQSQERLISFTAPMGFKPTPKVDTIKTLATSPQDNSSEEKAKTPKVDAIKTLATSPPGNSTKEKAKTPKVDTIKTLATSPPGNNSEEKAETLKVDETKANTDAAGTIQGFGAPLWVLFLAVVGSALFTVALIVKEIHEPPDFTNLDRDDGRNLRVRIENIIQHQFYILFAPLGGFFLYQMLVLAGSASQHVFVGIAALGAGAMLNLLLAKAIELVQSSMKTLPN